MSTNSSTSPAGAGQVAMVTGATSGLGLETAAALADRGMKVIFAVRNPKKAEQVAAEIRKRVPKADLVYPPEVPAVDFQNLDSIKKFAAAINGANIPLTILINNAGASRLPNETTPEGVASLAQANYLGPWLLTHLLEPLLVANHARVVFVSSLTARTCAIAEPKTFLTKWWSSWYKHTKLAMTIHAFELQRRLGPAGVTVAAVDPGGVNTAIWTNTVFSKPPIKQIIDQLYAPAEDAATSVVYAATVPWEVDAEPGVAPGEDLRFYARGMCASPLITHLDGAWDSWLATPRWAVWGGLALVHSLLDYPLRHWSGGRLCSGVMRVPAPHQAYDKKVARELWELSEQITGTTGTTPAAATATDGVGAGKHPLTGAPSAEGPPQKQQKVGETPMPRGWGLAPSPAGWHAPAAPAAVDSEAAAAAEVAAASAGTGPEAFAAMQPAVTAATAGSFGSQQQQQQQQVQAGFKEVERGSPGGDAAAVLHPAAGGPTGSGLIKYPPVPSSGKAGASGGLGAEMGGVREAPAATPATPSTPPQAALPDAGTMTSPGSALKSPELKLPLPPSTQTAPEPAASAALRLTAAVPALSATAREAGGAPSAAAASAGTPTRPPERRIGLPSEEEVNTAAVLQRPIPAALLQPDVLPLAPPVVPPEVEHAGLPAHEAAAAASAFGRRPEGAHPPPPPPSEVPTPAVGAYQPPSTPAAPATGMTPTPLAPLITPPPPPPAAPGGKGGRSKHRHHHHEPHRAPQPAPSPAAIGADRVTPPPFPSFTTLPQLLQLPQPPSPPTAQRAGSGAGSRQQQQAGPSSATGSPALVAYTIAGGAAPGSTTVLPVGGMQTGPLAAGAGPAGMGAAAGTSAAAGGVGGGAPGGGGGAAAAAAGRGGGQQQGGGGKKRGGKKRK